MQGKKFLLFFGLVPSFLSALQQPPESHFVVHDEARVTFTQPTNLFRRIQMVVLGTGMVPVSHLSSLAPRVTRATTSTPMLEVAIPAVSIPSRPKPNSLVRPGTLIAPPPRPAKPAAPKPLPAKPGEAINTTNVLSEEQLDDVMRFLGGEIDQIGRDVIDVRQQVADLIRGSYDLPIAKLSSQDAARLNERCAVLEKRFDVFDHWAKNALTDLPIIQTFSDTTSLSVLAPFLQPTRGGPGAQLSRSVTLPFDKAIEVSSHMVLNGNGESISFAGGNAVQVKVKAGATLTLENITLKNLHKNTIAIEKGGTLICGENVEWELHQNMVLETGRLEVAGEHTVMRIHGIGSRHKLTVGQDARVSIYTNTIALSNIILAGVKQLSSHTAARSRESAQVGGVALCGNAQLYIEDTLPIGVTVAGQNNELVCRSSDVVLHEPIIFADHGHNELFMQIDHSMQHAAMCTLAGEIFLVSSANGTAHLHIRNEEMYWQLSDQGSCVIGEHGMLYGHVINTSGYPLVSATDANVLSPETRVTSASDNALSISLPGEYTAIKYSAWHELYGTSESILVAGDMVHANTVQLRAMEGPVIVDGGTVTDWSIAKNKTVDTRIRLRGGATLLQGNEATTLKEHDSIYVHDTGNEIVVNGALHWHGQLSCSVGSELTITCKPGAQLNISPQVAKSWHIAAGARVIIRGSGTVTFGTNFDLSLAQTAGGVSQFILEDGITCVVASGTTWQVGGKGVVLLDNDASCMLEPGARWFVGTQQQDEVAVHLDRHSSVLVGHGPTTCSVGLPAQWSCALGRYSLTIDRRSTIYVAPRSSLECNMRNGEDRPGLFEHFHFSQKGNLYLAHDALLRLADNRVVGGRKGPIMWQQHNGGIYGDGLVGDSSMHYEGASSYGQCQQKTRPTDCHNKGVMARELIADLINLSKILQSTLYFVNSEGTAMVQTKRRVVVPLTDGDRVMRDNAAGDIFVARAGQEKSSYTLNASGK